MRTVIPARASRLIARLVVPMLLVAVACDRVEAPTALDANGATHRISAPTQGPSKDLYNYSGDLYDGGDGELYPSSTSTPTSIDSYYTSISPSSGCTGVGSSTCSIGFEAFHNGQWNFTEQDLSFSVGGSSPSPQTLTGDICLEHDYSGDITLCTYKVADNTYSASSSTSCGADVTAGTTHKAWWAGQINVNLWVVSFSFGPFGEVDKTSIAQRVSLPSCPSGSYEDGDGGETCYDAYLVWYDEYGWETDEEWLAQICCDSQYGCRVQ